MGLLQMSTTACSPRNAGLGLRGSSPNSLLYNTPQAVEMHRSSFLNKGKLALMNTSPASPNALEGISRSKTLGLTYQSTYSVNAGNQMNMTLGRNRVFKED